MKKTNRSTSTNTQDSRKSLLGVHKVVIVIGLVIVWVGYTNLNDSVNGKLSLDGWQYLAGAIFFGGLLVGSGLSKYFELKGSKKSEK